MKKIFISIYIMTATLSSLNAFTYNFTNGWNLSGVDEEFYMGKLINSCVKNIYTYDKDKNNWNKYNISRSGGYEGHDTSIKKGEGFWVEANASCSVYTGRYRLVSEKLISRILIPKRDYWYNNFESVVIHSDEELKAFLSIVDNKLWSFKPEFFSVINSIIIDFEKYNLVFFMLIEPSGSIKVTPNQAELIRDIPVIKIDEYYPSMGTADMAHYSFAYLVDKSFPNITFITDGRNVKTIDLLKKEKEERSDISILSAKTGALTSHDSVHKIATSQKSYQNLISELNSTIATLDEIVDKKNIENWITTMQKAKIDFSKENILVYTLNQPSMCPYSETVSLGYNFYSINLRRIIKTCTDASVMHYLIYRIPKELSRIFIYAFSEKIVKIQNIEQ